MCLDLHLITGGSCTDFYCWSIGLRLPSGRRRALKVLVVVRVLAVALVIVAVVVCTVLAHYSWISYYR